MHICVVFKIDSQLSGVHKLENRRRGHRAGGGLKLTAWCIIESGSAADAALERLMDDSSTNDTHRVCKLVNDRARIRGFESGA